MVSMSTEEAAPVEKVEIPMEQVKEPVSEAPKRVEETTLSEDEKKEDGDAAANDDAPVQEATPTESTANDSKEDVTLNDVKSEEVTQDYSKTAADVSTNEVEEAEESANVLAAVSDDVEAGAPSDDVNSSEETNDVETGTVAAVTTEVETSEKPTTQELVETTPATVEGAPLDDVKADEGQSQPTDDTQGDIEEAIPAPLADGDKAPESPSRGDKDLIVEHAVPPESPERDAKKEIDPDSPSRETDLEGSFDSSAGAMDGHVEGVKKSNRRRNHFIFGGIIVALIVGAVLGILFGTGVVGSKNEEPAVANPSQAGATATDSPTIAPGPGDVPAPAPTEGVAPKPAPTEGDAPKPAPTEPATAQDDPLLESLKGLSSTGLDDTTSPQYQAYQWMKNEDPLTDANTDPAKLQQRYSLATMYASLLGDFPYFTTEDECSWPAVVCNTVTENATDANATNLFRAESGQVTEIHMARKFLTGTIPPEIFLLGPSLEYIDLGENEISGSIPDELYKLINLKYLYLHDNQMTGTLSEGIGNLQVLDSLYLGSNRFSGPIPYNMGSRGVTRRPLRYLILQDNEFTGTIPNEMSLTSLFHMDLSFNQLTGTLPADIGDNFRRLKQLYLDHNQFTGTIPTTYPQAGGGRLYVLTLDNNQLTGGVPTGWDKDNLFLDTITVQGNKLTEPIDKEICQFSALQNGELVQVGAECDICTCKVLCDNCY